MSRAVFNYFCMELIILTKSCPLSGCVEGRLVHVGDLLRRQVSLCAHQLRLHGDSAPLLPGDVHPCPPAGGDDCAQGEHPRRGWAPPSVGADVTHTPAAHRLSREMLCQAATSHTSYNTLLKIDQT